MVCTVIALFVVRKQNKNVTKFHRLPHVPFSLSYRFLQWPVEKSDAQYMSLFVSSMHVCRYTWILRFHELYSEFRIRIYISAKTCTVPNWHDQFLKFVIVSIDSSFYPLHRTCKQVADPTRSDLERSTIAIIFHTVQQIRKVARVNQRNTSSYTVAQNRR